MAHKKKEKRTKCTKIYNTRFANHKKKRKKNNDNN